jgi:hypothetical protein
MLDIINATPVDLGGSIALTGSLDVMRKRIFENGTVYCIKNCFHAADIDAMRQGVFDHYAQIPQAKFNIQSVNFEDPKQLDRNHHVIVRGISSYQKTLHYFHVYGFGDIDMLPSHIKTPVHGVFTSMIGLYNQLTEQDAGIDTIFRNTKKIRPQFIQYPVGGGMFATHIHEYDPQKLGFVLAISKRGRDFQEAGTGFEAPDGSIVDTSTVHDIGDLLIFRYDLKHWVTACDINSPLDDTLSSGRWTAAIPIY